MLLRKSEIDCLHYYIWSADKVVLKLLLPALLAFMPQAQATELRSITVRTGTEGLEPAPLTISNEATLAVSCTAEIAHWYSVEIATAAPGASARIDLWFDPETGIYAALNDARENLPVERLWCGFAGRAYETRSQIALDRRIGQEPKARSMSCAAQAGRVVCG